MMLHTNLCYVVTDHHTGTLEKFNALKKRNRKSCEVLRSLDCHTELDSILDLESIGLPLKL